MCFQRCCYNFYGGYYYYYYYYYWYWSSWWWWGYGFLDTSYTYQSGSMLQYNPYFYPSQNQLFDVLPKRWCCLESNNCHLYYQVRPQASCIGYFMPFFGE